MHQSMFESAPTHTCDWCSLSNTGKKSEYEEEGECQGDCVLGSMGQGGQSTPSGHEVGKLEKRKEENVLKGSEIQRLRDSLLRARAL